MRLGIYDTIKKLKCGVAAVFFVGATRQASDIAIETRHMLKVKEHLSKLLAKAADKSVRGIEMDTIETIGYSPKKLFLM